jgi:opacity protein-like surface antigen
MQRLVLGALVALLSTSLLQAQTANESQFPKIELSGGYLYTGEFPYNVFRFPIENNGNVALESDFGTRRGFALSFTRNLNRHIGFRAEFSSQFHHDESIANFTVQGGTATFSASQPIELTPKLFNFLVGPEIKFRNRTRFTPLLYDLFGFAHTAARFSTSGAALSFNLPTTETGFSMAYGGGLQVRINGRFSVRTSVDFNPKRVGRDDNGARQDLNDLRGFIGVVFH